MAVAASRIALRGRAVRSGRPPPPAPAEAHAVVSLINTQSPLYPHAPSLRAPPFILVDSTLTPLPHCRIIICR